MLGLNVLLYIFSTLRGRKWSKDYRENRRSLWQRSSSHMVKHNIETTHTDVNTANFKIINMNFSNSKKTPENCRVFMDQRPETYTKCTGEINTSDAL